jgi:hypothetical protein
MSVAFGHITSATALKVETIRASSGVMFSASPKSSSWRRKTASALISGTVHPTNEFLDAPRRVIKHRTRSSSCNDDERVWFDEEDFLWCSHRNDAPRQFGLTHLITFNRVRRSEHHIPSFEPKPIEFSRPAMPWHDLALAERS